VDEELHIIATPNATLKAVNKKSYNMATKDLSANATTYEIPIVSKMFKTDGLVHIFTNMGNSIQLSVSNINQCKFRDKGANLVSYAKGVNTNEKIVNMLDLGKDGGSDVIVMVSKFGMIKKSPASEYICAKSYVAGMKLKDGDEVIAVELVKQGSQMALFTKDGIGMVVPIDDIAVSGRVSVGVKGIQLATKDEVVSAMQVTPEDAVTIFANNGLMHTIKYKQIPQSLRNKKGTKIITVKNDIPKLVYARRLTPNTEFVVEKDKGVLKLVKSSKIPVVKPLDRSLKMDKPIKVVNVYPFMITE